MEVLLCLASRAGETVPKDELLKTVWPDTYVTDDGLVRSISELRRVFEDDAREPRFIQTIPKRGYRLVAPVEPANGRVSTPTFASQSPVIETSPAQAEPERKIGAPLLAGSAFLLLVLILGFVNIRRLLLRESPSPSIRSIAVLPLENLSGDPTQEYFSDGMTDALITDLAQIGSLKVISRTSSMQYKQTKKSLPEIARELGVDGIVEGTVQRYGDRVRITAQLIHGSSDKHVWANSYERELRDVFVLERDVTDDIAQQVQARLKTRSESGPTRPRPVDPKVLDAYVRGSYYLNGRGRGAGDEERKKAREYFQQAIDLDPNFAPAYIGLADAHDVLSWPEPEDVVITRRLAERAVELDPTSSDARLELGQAKWEDWDWSGAEEDFRRALALNPNNIDARGMLGSVLDVTGRLDEGWKESQIAQELDPKHDHLAESLYQRGQFDQAIEIRQRIAIRDPVDGYNHYALAMNYAHKQMFKEFTLEMGKATTLYGLPEVASRLQHAYDQSGGQGILREWAKELEHLAATRVLYLPGALAQLYATLGDKNRAFYWLEEFRSHHDVATADPTIYFKTDPWFTPLRSDPRFNDFLRRVGLSP
jgi:TolB-like protein/DNA-binding winged helix-turn-helix (wHTH) protein/Tfp pilus assembly protein PilF